MLASVARKITGVPILFTEHNGFMEKGKIAARNLKFKPDKYIALSEDFKIWVKKYYPAIDVEYIPNGVDFARFNPDVKPALIELSRPIILTASRFQPNKRLEYIIDAVSMLESGSLLMLTSGKNLEELNQKGKKLLGDRFKLKQATFDEMPAYYRACDVFTLPSIYEPFGLVYLEAMACNKPVVAPNDLSRASIIGDAGILFNIEDVEDYAKCLTKAINTDFMNIPLNQARKFTWDSCVDKYYKVIQSMTIQIKNIT
ncbi:MAG: glycosyltransferase [Desulfobacterales bacterium]|nr:glycosyltransferase [Desulfobacterales bacterium]